MPRWTRRRHGVRVMSRPNSAIEPSSGAISPVIRLNKRGLAGAVGADDQPPLARRDSEIDALGDAQAAERFGQPGDAERGHGRSPAAAVFTGRQPPPGPAPQPHRAGHQPFRHEDDDGDEDEAEHQVPAHDVGAHHVLGDDDDRRTDHGAGKRRGAAGNHHQQHLGRGLQRRDLRADELVVVDEQDRRRCPTRKPENRKARNRISQTL